MVDFQNKKIFYTLREYQNNYDILLKNYLIQHEDFDELMFLEIEMQFYSLCYDNSNVVIGDIGYGPQYCINDGHCELLIPEINEAISLNNGFNIELSSKFNASFNKILEFLIAKTDKARTENINLYTINNKNLSISDTYNENLENDPLLNLDNEYQSLKSKFKEDYSLRTAHLNNVEDVLLHNFDDDFKNWENKQNEEIKISLLNLIKQLNQNKTFFFGCSFDNYKHNYSKRLNNFLEHYVDATETDFIDQELEFLENILYDIQDSESAHDGFSVSGYDSFSKAYGIITELGYKQYLFSHKKKIDFLNKHKDYVSSQELSLQESNTDKVINDLNVLKNEMKITINFIATELKKEGYTDEQITKHIQEVRETQSKNIQNIISDIPDDLKGDFLAELTPKINPVFTDIKKRLFKDKIDSLLTIKRHTKENSISESVKQPSLENQPQTNNILKSTIEDYIEEFKPDINGNGYETLVNALFEYFSNGSFPILENKIKFKKINKKRVGWALKELYKSEKTENLEIEYFRFAQENINLFEKEVIVDENFNKSNFYKSFTSNPAK